MRIDCCVSYFQKQLIGLLPNGTECLFYYAPDVNIDFWSIDSYTWDEVDALNTFLNPYGIYYNAYYVNNIAEPRLILTYIGTEPPTYKPTINDPNANPVTWDWTNCCTIVCLEATLSAGEFVLLSSGYFNEALQNPHTFDDPNILDFLKYLYGQQTSYTYTDNGDGTFYIKIDNAYVCNPPLSWSEDNVTYTDMVPCGTPPPTVCLFTTNTFTDSTGNNCFTLPGYNFNGQGIDFTAAANVYGGYAIQYGNSSTIPYGVDTCSVVTFSYIGYSQPADIIVNDPSFGVINLPLSAQFCEKGCLTTNSILLKDTYDGINIGDYIYLPFSSFGTVSLDFVNDLAGAEAYINLILSKFCPGAIVNITADGADYFTLTFNNLYYNVNNLNFQLFDNSGIPSISTTLVPC